MSVDNSDELSPRGQESGGPIFPAANSAEDTECTPQQENRLTTSPSSAMSGELSTVEEFKALMYRMQSVRRQIVASILRPEPGPCPSANGPIAVSRWPLVSQEWLQALRRTYAFLTDSNTSPAFQRNMLSASSEKFPLNVKDEVLGLEKDLLFLELLQREIERNPDATTAKCLLGIDFVEMLKPYHPISSERFEEEFNDCVRFLDDFTSNLPEDTNSSSVPRALRLPIMITDWDGTMKDYCSQYATNLQPIYTAISMARFAEKFTRLTAVLTAGPLRGPGILDLTALPIDGPVMFSGSWGREWWLGGKRVVHDDGISEEGIDALERFNDEMRTLLSSSEYAQFGLVGSGVQRKVDRLTLGVQTVCGHVQPELSSRYQDQVRERVHRVDPLMRMLHFDPSTELEVEVVLKNNDTVWNKSHGVKKFIETVGDSLEPPGKVLICGDTSSDLPMVQHASAINPEGVMTLFVGANENLKRRVSEFVPQASNRCFVSCPDVIHAAMMKLLRDRTQPCGGGNDESLPQSSSNQVGCCG